MTTEEKMMFEKAVKDIVGMIPSGRATSYGAIARAAGYPDLSRAVGRILGNLSGCHYLPAHRVVNSRGRLCAKHAFGSVGRMEQLLAAEGVSVVNDVIENWERVFWNPLTEINVSE